jgi:hypothetical protein
VALEVWRHGGRASVRHWSKYNGERREAAEVARGENVKLKRLLAESMLDVSTLREMLENNSSG